MINKNIKIKKVSLGLMVVFALFGGLFISINYASADNATVTCNNAVWSATLHGTVTPNGASTEAWFEWGTNTSLSFQTPHQTFSSNSSYSQNLTPLAENTTYYYQAIAQNQYGRAEGTIRSFNTSTCNQPAANGTITVISEVINDNGGNLSESDFALYINGNRVTSRQASTLSAGNYSISSDQRSGYSRSIRGACDGNGLVTLGAGQNLTCIISNNDIAQANNTQVPNPTVTITANPSSVAYGGASTLSWSSANATSCVANGGSNNWSGNRSTINTFYTGNLTSSTTYTITCTNADGSKSATDSTTVTVGAQPNNTNTNTNTPNPTVTISANPSTVNYNGTSTVSWSSANATSCVANGGSNNWSGNRGISGTFTTGNLIGSTVYSITCTNSAGTGANAVTTVGVNGQQQTSSYSYQYPTPYTYPTPYQSYYPTPYIYQSNYYPTPYQTPYIAQSYIGSSYTTPYYINNSQPTVSLSADKTNLSINEATFLRWYTTNATSCFASNGSTGWAGTKGIGPTSFYTGSLLSTQVYNITCSNSFGSASDSVTIRIGSIVSSSNNSFTSSTSSSAPSSLVIITSSVDRNQPIVPTIDNTRPRVGDEINYTVSYQNIGTASISRLTLRVNIPPETDYILSSPNSPTRSGNALVFNLGTLGANKEGTVSIRVRVRDDVSASTYLNFPATLSYVDSSGQSQSVDANVSAQVWDGNSGAFLTAGVFNANFLPGNLLGWLLLIIFILLLILIVRYLLDQPTTERANPPALLP